MRWEALLLFAVLMSLPRAAWPQGMPLGPEFRVNSHTTSNQFFSAVAADSSGNFVVVWSSYAQDGSGFGVLGQRYDSPGGPLGHEFQVNTYTTGNQFSPAVAVDTSGNFVVVWQSAAQDGSGYGVFGQRYASSGAPLGPEFRVNTSTTSHQAEAAVAADSSGNFVVFWHSDAHDGSGRGVVGQRYASSGGPLGPEFQVNTHTTDYQSRPAVAADSSGNFVAVWASHLQDGSSYGVFGQRYASSGAPLGPEFQVNIHSTNGQASPAVAADSSGNFVVAWHSYTQDGSGYGLFGQRYGSSGVPLGPEFRINTYTTTHQMTPSVTADSSGNFVVVWLSFLQERSSGVFGQRYTSAGTPLGPEFQVNTYTTDYQSFPAVAADSSGNFVVVWDSQMQDGSELGVFGQRYGQIVPVELMRFTVE